MGIVHVLFKSFAFLAITGRILKTRSIYMPCEKIRIVLVFGVGNRYYILLLQSRFA